MIQICLGNNIDILPTISRKAAVIFSDCVYEVFDKSWVYEAIKLLKDDGVFILMTDYHTSAEYKLYLDKIGMKFLNWCIYKQEWGGTPRRGFPQKHDDILIYTAGDKFKWYGDRVQIKKITVGTAFDKKGTGLKTPCSVFDDLGNFSTMSNERIKDDTLHNIKWQKPMKLMDRLLFPFTDEGDLIIDPFLGSGTTAIWCKNNNRDCIGIEIDPVVLEIAKRRIGDKDLIRKTEIEEDPMDGTEDWSDIDDEGCK